MVGLFFGSFNPIHNGHLNIAHYLLDHDYFGEIWFVISPQNPLKQDSELLAETERIKIVRAAIAGDSRMKACDVEFSMPKPSYTTDTLKLLSGLHPDIEFALIIGEDNLRDFHLWKDYANIAAAYPVFVYPRPDVDTSGISYKNVTRIKASLSEVSSTAIRQKIRNGEDVSRDVPAEILSMIQEAYRIK